MKYIVTINGKKYEVEVEKIADANDKAQAKEVPSKSKESVESISANGGIKITAPMPGKILSVNIAEGQKVKKGDVLFILEAMKMENEIMAPQDGTVSNIAVSKGAQVSSGDILAVLK